MEKVERGILAFLFGVLLVLVAVTAHATAPKDKTLDPDTCQEDGTCWIPAGGDPQPILEKVKKGGFNAGYEAGQKFLIPGSGKKTDAHLLWMVIVEEWYGPWCLVFLDERSYYKCLQGIVFESRGNPYAATKSEVWIERGLTSVNDGFAEEHDFDPCGDPKVCIWAASQENHERRDRIENGKSWSWLDGHTRHEKERWLASSGSLNASTVVKMAKKANAHKITPEQVEKGGATPWKRLVGQIRKWDKSGMIYLMKTGISIGPWYMGSRMARKLAQEKRYPMLSWRPDEMVTVNVTKKAAKKLEIPKGPTEIPLEGRTVAQLAEEYYTTPEEIVAWNAVLGVDEMCYGSDQFYDPGIMPPMPTPKAPFPGSKQYGASCLKYQHEWREIMGKTLSDVVRRGDPKFKKMQEEGWFPTEEEYAWWEENIGRCKVADSPVVQHLLPKIN